MSRSETAKLWQERLRRFDRSQMTVTQFCLSEGVSLPSFYQWKKKLRERPSDAEPMPMPKPKPKPKPKPSITQFMPVRLANDFPHQVASAPDEQVAPSLACTTIELPGGVRIRVEVPTVTQPRQSMESRA